VMAVEESFGVTLSVGEVGKVVTVGEIVELAWSKVQGRGAWSKSEGREIMPRHFRDSLGFDPVRTMIASLKIWE